ncbi:MAG: hypothetical protein KC413_03245, partial [Anaerolineales bacterium]|nr:hypothetical protein [Anaerolineales bacterium]
YGLDFAALPTWEPGAEQTLPARQSFNQADPAPGFYAISVTNLHGIVLGEQRDAFAWFRDKEPVARPGGSIFVYEVAAHGAPVNAAFSGLRPAERAPELHDALATNDVRVRWFEAQTSLIWPVAAGWWALPVAQQIDALLLPYAITTTELLSADGTQRLRQPLYPPALPWPVTDTADSLPAAFLGYTALQIDSAAGEVALITGWQVTQATERPLKIFVHALDAAGQIVGQWDGLDVDAATWQPGDLFVQLHRFPVSETAVIHSFAVGLYDGETLERLLEPIAIVPGE